MASSIDQEPLQSPIEQLKNIFDLCDQDHDGYITVDEFRSLGQEYLGGVSQIDILVNEMDPDNSGVITFNSFRKGIEQYLISRSDSVSSTSHTSIEDGGSESSPFSPSGVIYDQANIPDIITYISSLDDSFHHQYNHHPEGTDHNGDVIMNGLRVKESSGHSSYNDINIQPSDVSPSMMAKSLMKRSNHSLLQMSNGGTPDWTFDEDNDELTDKLQELSTRLEALEVDLDCSQTETLRLKRENMALRERLEMFQDTLSDVEHDKDESIRQLKNQCNNNIEKLKRENERAIEELQYELQQEQNSLIGMEQCMASLKDQMEEKDIELQSVSDRASLLEYKKREIEEQLAKTRQQLKQERDKWAGEKEENQQETVAMNHVIQHLRNELEEKKTTKKRNATTTSDMRLGEILKLKQEIKSLTEERDNLSGQLLRQGQLLVAETPQSLADELKDAPKADIMKALKDQEDLNVRLKAYIEGLLVTILNSHPELLEVKSPTHRR